MRRSKEKARKETIIKWLYAPQNTQAPLFDCKRYLIPAVIAYGCGICLILSRYRAAARELSIYLFAIIMIYTAVLTGLVFVYKHRKNAMPRFLHLKWRILPVVLLVIFVLGMYRAHYEIEFQYRTLKDMAGSMAWVRGTVETVPKLTNSGQRIGFVLLPYHMENANREELGPLSGKIQVYLPAKYETQLHRNDAIEGYLELETPTGARFTGGFDYACYLNQNGIPVIGFGKYVTITEEKPQRNLLQRYQDWGIRINHSIQESIGRHFSYDEESAAIITGILIGDKSGFSDELYQDFSNSGIIHVAAVSGLHVSFLIAALSFLLKRIRLPKSIIHLLLIPPLLLFMSAALFTPSVCRAVIMTILFLLSYTIQKEPDQKTAVFAASGIMLTINPYLLFNAGFLLSFSAVLGIQLFNTQLDTRFHTLSRTVSAFVPDSALQRMFSKAASYFASSFSISISSFLGTVYFSTYFFQIFSLSGVIACLWVIPCVMLLFIGGYLIWLCDFFIPWLGQFTRCFLVLPLEIIKQTAKIFSSSRLTWQVHSPSTRTFFFYIVLLFLLHFYLKHSQSFNQEKDERNE